MILPKINSSAKKAGSTAQGGREISIPNSLVIGYSFGYS